MRVIAGRHWGKENVDGGGGGVKADTWGGVWMGSGGGGWIAVSKTWSGIGISTNLGQDSRWEWLVYVILRVWWVGDEIIKFEKDV